MEEVYFVVAGDGVFRVDEETFEIGPRDVIRVTPESWRGWEAGAEGLELLAFGEHVEGDGESEMDMEWWPKG
jgi:mannose-6-phosphate isomerase-like protein (cupin superfamily)